MYYLKEILGNCVRLVLWSAMIPLLLCTVFFPFSMLMIFAVTDEKLGPGLMIYYTGYFFLLMTVLIIRIYLIIEKWDQIMSVKNKNKILELGNEGISLLKPNYGWTEIQELRKQQKK